MHPSRGSIHSSRDRGDVAKEQLGDAAPEKTWRSSNGDTKEEWLEFHGNAPHQWERVKHKMKALKVLQVAQENGDDMTSLLEHLEERVKVTGFTLSQF